MKNITSHHDGFGLNDLIDVEMSDEDANGVPHRVDFYRRLTDAEFDEFRHVGRFDQLETLFCTCKCEQTDSKHDMGCAVMSRPRLRVGFFQMQHGPRNVEGSRPGLITDAILAALIEIMAGFQAGPFKSREGALVITKLGEAALWSHKRARDRAARGVLGHNKA